MTADILDATQAKSAPRKDDASVERAIAGFAEATDLALIIINQHGRIAFVNQATEQMFGHQREALIGRSLDLIIPERLRGAHTAGVARIQAGLPPKLAGRTVEVAALHADGREFPVEIGMAAWQGADGMMMSGVIRDVSERRERAEKLAGLSRLDALTGLPNRLEMMERLQDYLDDKVDTTVMLIGLDGLKKINDDLGYKVGDTILQSLAIRLPALVSKDALMCRPEGSLFALVLPEMGDPMRAMSIARDVLRTVNSPLSIGEHVVRLGANIGIAIGPSQGYDADELVANADLALPRTQGTATARLFEPAMRSAIAARRAMNDEIRHAVEGQELELYFQPQIDMTSGAIIGAEALLRWNHHARGLLAPAAFLAALESHSLAPQVGDWIIDEACRHVAIWRRSGLLSARVSVNLFAGQLRAGNLVQVVRDALRRHQLPPESLELEVTETTALGAGADLDRQFRALRDAKLRIAFDDFGTGHASLSLLKRFPITTIKIDRGFVRDIQKDRFDRAIIQALLDMSGIMGLDVVAEGIETEAQEKKLLEIGCRFGQGYYYARPLPQARFMRFCTKAGALAKSA
ncbi:MAG: putative bifunctional diguanylate cyclase/phosphodiesterase [Rhizobiaceae bacterium]